MLSWIEKSPAYPNHPNVHYITTGLHKIIMTSFFLNNPRILYEHELLDSKSYHKGWE